MYTNHGHNQELKKAIFICSNRSCFEAMPLETAKTLGGCTSFPLPPRQRNAFSTHKKDE